MKHSHSRLVALTLSLGALAACSGSDSDGGVVPGGQTGGPLRPLAGERLGDPIPGLTPEQRAAFRRGEILFKKAFKPSEGLGPFYNATSCASCHSTPVAGGSSELYRNFYIAMIGEPPFQFALPGLPSPVVPSYGSLSGDAPFTLEQGRMVIPEDFGSLNIHTAQRNAVPVFGTGLFEFISDATIQANADPLDIDGDGISGRPNIESGDVGRFGVKAQANNVERFTRPPLFNQMSTLR